MGEGRSSGFGVVDGGTTSELLRAIVEADRAMDRAQVAQARRLVAWADAHVVTDPGQAATQWADVLDTGVPIAGPGAPLVSEFALRGLCAARGRSMESGRRQVGLVIEIAWRLPRIWARVVAFDVPLWKALRVAELSRPLAATAAGFVDQHLHHALAGCSRAQIDRTVAEAIRRHDPETAEQQRLAAADTRYLDLDFNAPSNLEHGLTPVSGLLDAGDAVDLDKALARRAEVLARYITDQAASLDVRRSIAAGEMARGDLALDLEHVDETTGEVHVVSQGRDVVLHVHLTDAALRSRAHEPDTCVARLDADRGPLGYTPIATEQVREWCGAPGTRISVKPVIDLTDRQAVDAYEIPDRLREHVVLRNLLCGFPFCNRRAADCDLDHAVPHNQGGPTSTDNLAPICRAHHRLKTHAWGWRYTLIDPTTRLWFSPEGLTWLVDPHGTRLLATPQTLDPPDPPPPDDTRPDCVARESVASGLRPWPDECPSCPDRRARMPGAGQLR